MYNPRLDKLERIAAENKPLPSTTGYADGCVLAVVDEEYTLVPLGQLLPQPLYESGDYNSATGEVATDFSESDISGAFNAGIPIITDPEVFGVNNVLYPSYSEGSMYQFTSLTASKIFLTNSMTITTISYEFGDDVLCKLTTITSTLED